MASLKRTLRTRLAAVMALVVLAAVALPVVGAAVAQTGPPGIAFLNPSDYGGQDPPIISDRLVEGDASYRLNAWVANVPADPVVEFEVQIAPGVIEVLSPAERIGHDTWEFQWNVRTTTGLVPNNIYEMRAIVFSGANEVGRDTQSFRFRHGVPNDSAAAPRVEFVNPLNGGEVGGYVRPGPSSTDPPGTATMMREIGASGGTNTIRGFYTVTPPGEPPEWAQCGNGPRCTLADGVDPTSVTALAAIANNDPNPLTSMPQADQSGDAVRIQPYLQVPTTVTVTPPFVQSPATCTPNMEVRVVDQFNRPIAAANVDVHAVGPTSSLRFDTGGELLAGPPSANQAPNEGPHTVERGWACSPEDTISPSNQGEHRRVGLPSIKHIESTSAATGGTDNVGTWRFRLRSPQAGDSHVVVWADRANNDVFSPGDPCQLTAIAWTTDSEAVPPVPNAGELGPEFGGCSIAQPEVTASPTTTTSPTPTASPTQDDVLTSGPCAGFPRDSRTEREGGNGFVIVGTAGDDLLEGSDGDDIICGLEGDDDLRGLGGHDTIDGGPGDDTIRGGPGDDVIFGGGGHDTINGGPGGDTIRGGRGNDLIRGGAGPDIIHGGRGHDILRGGKGPDSLRGGRGNDELYGGAGDDFLNGGRGTDLCRGGRGRDTFRNCER